MCETYKALAVSTAHLTPEDIIILQQEAADSEEWMVMAREPGFFIKLYDEVDANLHHGHSESIKKIIEYAVNQGFRMIEFDRDASELELFPVYEHRESAESFNAGHIMEKECNELINWLGGKASKFYAFECILDEVKKRFKPEVVTRAVNNYGLGFTGLEHVYQDMLNRS